MTRARKAPAQTDAKSSPRGEPGSSDLTPFISADHVAVAIVAACREVGVDVAEAFTSNRGCRKARMVAAAGCVARLGWPRTTAARLFQLDPVKLAPSMLAEVSISVEHLMAVSEALSAAGLIPAGATARFRSPWTREAVRTAAKKAVANTSCGRVTKTQARAKAAAVAKPAPVAKVAAVTVRPVAPTPPAPAAKPRPQAPSKPRVLKLTGAIQPISPRGLIFIRRFLASGWPVDEVAELFDTTPEAIAAAHPAASVQMDEAA